MSEKFTLKIIQHGQTQQVKVLRPGAGISGQAVVVKATNGARFQMADLVTLVAPQKIQLKRIDGNLHLALPGGDIDAPDLVIQDYFNVTGASLQGANIAGEMLSYDTSSLTSPSAGLFDKVQTALTGETSEASEIIKSEAVTLGESASLFGNPWAWAGLAAVGAAAGGGGGGGGGTPQTSSFTGLNALKTYAGAANGNGVKAPTLANYKEADIKALGSLAETDANASADIDSATVTSAVGTTWLQALNSALDKQTSSSLDKATLQKMAASYYRILYEADGVVNTTSDVDVYPVGTNAASSDPLATDYANIGATVGNAKSVDLLNDYVGAATKDKVDTVDEINVIAKAAYNVMQLAGGGDTTKPAGSKAVAAGTTAPAIYSTTDNNAEWIAGLNTLLGLTTSKGINSSNIVAVKAALAGHPDGVAVDTVQEIKDLIKEAMATQALKDYANATNGAGVTAPTLTTYKDAGVTALASLSETDAGASADISSAAVTNSMGATWLQALNSALDKQVGDSALTSAKLKTMAASYYRILSEADGVVNTTTNTDVKSGTSNDPLASDYTNIGATVGNAKSVDLLNDYVGAANKDKVDTVDEINVIAKAAYNVMLQAGDAAATGAVPAKYSETDNNAEWIAGLNTLMGLNTTTGVNVSNIGAFKTKINSAGGAANVDTVAELQGLLGAVRLQAFADDTGTYYVTSATNTKNTAANPAPTLDDWAGFGVKANTNLSNAASIAINQATYWKTTNPSNGLMALNSALDTKTFTGTKATDLTSLQTIADSYGRILQEADGSRATNTDVKNVSTTVGINTEDVVPQDLINVGVDQTVLNNLKTGDLLAKSIGSLSSTAVDTVQELSTLAGYAENIMKQAAATNAAGSTVTYTDPEWVTALSSLGVVGASNSASYNNISAIKSAIAVTDNAGTGVDTWDELQSIVSMVRMNDYAVSNTNYAATPTLADYQAIAATSTSGKSVATTYADMANKSSYLSSYNSAINSMTSIDLSTVAYIDKARDAIYNYTKLFDWADGTTNVTTASVMTAAKYNDIFGYGGNYSLQGVTGQMAADTKANLLSDVIDQLSASSIDTVGELAALGGVIDRLAAAANVSKTTGGTNSDYQGLSRTDLGLLGLKGQYGNLASDSSVTNNQFNYFCNSVVYSNDSGTEITSYAKLQSMLNTALAATV